MHYIFKLYLKNVPVGFVQLLAFFKKDNNNNNNNNNNNYYYYYYYYYNNNWKMEGLIEGIIKYLRLFRVHEEK